MKMWRYVFTIAAVVALGPSTDASTHCCDAAEQPGLPGQQHCAGGSTCCAAGDWSCNDATGAATCAACSDPADEQCCDPHQKPGNHGNSPCVEGASCCSTGAWQCNDGTGGSTCVAEGLVCSDCCDPTQEPGQSGTVPCFEGATCCANGQWQCNDASGQSTCGVNGLVCQCCDPLNVPSCIEGASCCADGNWQCNDATGNSTCALEGEACEPPCCDPADIPNTGQNPFCATGFECCGDGQWKCNDPDGLSTCPDPGGECPQLCGGIAGISCDEPGEFCKLPVGECCCDAVGICTEMPSACPEFLDPVCGCDGVTYDNECFADAAGVSVDHAGPCGQVCGGITGIPCDDGEYCRLEPGQCCCDFEGICVEIPVICPEDCDPVCGCDSQTYKNPCVAAMASASIDHVGPCFEGNGLITGVEFESKEKMRWSPEPDALFYNVYRYHLDSSTPLGAGECLETGIEDPSVVIPGAPAPGLVWSLLVSGQYADGQGPLGIGWTCETRTVSVPCQPEEQLLCEATGGIWDPLSCGHYPCGQFPDCDAIIPGCNCGPTRNFQPGVGCVDDPDCGS